MVRLIEDQFKKTAFVRACFVDQCEVGEPRRNKHLNRAAIVYLNMLHCCIFCILSFWHSHIYKKGSTVKPFKLIIILVVFFQDKNYLLQIITYICAKFYLDFFSSLGAIV